MGDFRPDRLKLEPYTPTFSVPLAYDETTVNDLVAERLKPGEFYVNSGGYYEFAYDGDFTSKRLDSAFKLENLSTGVPIQVNARDLNTSFETERVVPIPNTRYQEVLNYVVTKTGQGSRMSFSITNNYIQPVTVTLTLPEATYRGTTNVVSTTATILFGATATLSLNLDNVAMRLSRITPTTYGINTRVRIQPQSPTTVGSISVLPTLNKLAYQYVEGYLGNFQFEENRSTDIAIKLFNEEWGGLKDGIQFEDPQIRGTIINSMGYPAEVTVDDIYTTRPNSTARTYLNNLAGTQRYANTVPLPAAIRQPDADFTVPSTNVPSQTPQAVNKSNSDVGKAFTFFGELPNRLYYRLGIRGTRAFDGNYRFFGFDSSRVRVKFQAILPMDGRVYRYSSADTFTLDLPDAAAKGLGDFEYAELAAKLTNGFPCTAYVQLYVADENLSIFDSLIPAPDFSERRRLILAATVSDGPDYRVTAPREGNVQRFRITDQQYKLWQRRARFAIYRVRLSGPEGTPDPNDYPSAGFTAPQRRVRIYPDYKLKSQLGLTFKYRNNL